MQGATCDFCPQLAITKCNISHGFPNIKQLYAEGCGKNICFNHTHFELKTVAEGPKGKRKYHQEYHYHTCSSHPGSESECLGNQMRARGRPFCIGFTTFIFFWFLMGIIISNSNTNGGFPDGPELQSYTDYRSCFSGTAKQLC